MRDIALFILIFGSLPIIIRRPWIGILVWSVLSYANPHRLCYGPAYSFPFAQLVALTLFAALIFNRDGFNLPRSGLLLLWATFMVWMAVTTSAAFFPDQALNYLERIYKIQIITLLTIGLINTRERVFWLVVTIAGSIGFFGVKGGIFTFLTAGSYRVFGPADSFIMENNSLALATLMVIPLGLYLAHQSPWKYSRPVLYTCCVLALLSAIGSQSRGALLATLAVAGFLALKSQRKVLFMIALGFLIPTIFAFMPQSWHDRMSTIRTYDEDGSALGRLNSWQYSINVANDRITGGGLESWSYETFAIYAPEPLNVHAAHSIWFSSLADHGWPGLLMFMGIFGWTWFKLSAVIRRHKKDDAQWLNELARMLQVCLVAYFVGGSFLSLAYFDLPWHFVAIALILERESQKICAGKQSPVAANAGQPALEQEFRQPLRT